MTWNSAISVKITLDKNGRECAYRLDRIQVRWFRMKLDEARALLATGKAVRWDAKSTDG